MKKLLSILFIIFLTSGIRSIAQDVSPLPSATVKKLIAPNNTVFYYNTVDSAFWVFKGETGWLRLATNEQLIKYYVPYNGANDTIDLNTQLITSKKQLLPIFNGACSVPTILDNGDGSITVGDGEYHLSSRADGKGTESYLISGNIFTLTDNAMNYIVADYNSGSPIIKLISDVNLINETTVIPIYSAYRSGTILHFQNWDALGVALANKVHQSIVKTQRYRRESGLGISEFPTRYLSIGNGRVWVGAVPVSVDAISTNTDNLRLFYHSGGVWTVTVQSQYNNTQYDNGTNIVTLTSNRYAVNWLFRGIESQKHLYVVLGRGDYTLAQAQEAILPAIPTAISSHAMLIGKIIVQNGASTATSIQSAFDTQFSTATPNAHNDLTGRDASDVHPAGSITFTPTGTYTATTVATALAQIDANTPDRNIYNEIQAPTLIGDNIGLTQTSTTISIAGKEDKSNKVTSISGSSTDTQYPSAKLLYDQLALKAPVSGSGNYIWNGTSQQYGNFNVSGNGTVENLSIITNGSGNPQIKLSQTSDNPYQDFYRWSGVANDYYATRLINGVGDFKIKIADKANMGTHTWLDAILLTLDKKITFYNTIESPTAKFTTGASANTIFTGDATGLGIWSTVNSAIGGNVLTNGYLPYWDGEKLANSGIRYVTPSSGYPSWGITSDNQPYSRFIIENTGGGNSFALVAGKNNVTQEGFSIFNNTTGITPFYVKNNSDIQIYNLSGSNTHLVGALTDGTLANGFTIHNSGSGGQTTPSYIHLDNNFSLSPTRDACKIYLYNDGGGEKYGFGIGSSGDMQYHSNAFHDFYINNSKKVTVDANGLSVTGIRVNNLTNNFIPYYSNGLINSGLYYDGINFGFGSTSPFNYIGTAKNLQIEGIGYSAITYGVTSNPANNKFWRNITRNSSDGNSYQIQTIDDSGGGGQTAFQITRNGTSIISSSFENGTVKINNLSGTGTRITTSSSDGTLGSLANGTGFLKNDGSGNISYTYPEITDIKSTGSPLGYIATSNGSGGIEMRTPPLNITSFIKSKSATGIFNLAHSTVVYNNMLFVGERAANPKIVKFSNINDLSVYSSTTITGSGFTGQGLEYGYYVSSIGKICFSVRNQTAGLDIIELNPSDMTWTRHNFSTISGSYHVSSTDGTYIYIANLSYIKKIRVSDWTEILSVALPSNIQFPHAMAVNATRSELYLTGSIADPIYMAKINTSDLSYTQIDLSAYITHASDDMCYYDNGTTNKVFVGGEQFYGTEPYCGVVIETTNSNALSAIHIKPSYGLFIDGVKVYSASLDGYIQTFSALDPTNVSTFVLDGYAPNEVMATSTGRTFLTHWDATNSVLAEFYVPVPMPDPTSAVTSVFGRTGAVVAVSGDYSASQVTNAADKSTANTFADNITISKSSSPYFEAANTGASTTGGGFRISDESGFYRGTWGYNNNTNETYFYNQFNDPYKYILNNIEQFRMNTSGVFETRNLSSAPTSARSGFGGFYTKNNLPYFINSSGTETQLGSASGSMVYPSGSGIPIVSGGVAWGTTISIPGNTTQYLRADGTFATPTFTSQWTTDTYGITYANNVGIGVASNQNVRQTVLSSTSGYPAFAAQNTSSTGEGAYIYGGNTSSQSALKVLNYAGGTTLFDVKGNGSLFMNGITNLATSYGLYYNPTTKEVSYGAAGGGGGDSGTVTSFSSGSLSPLFSTSVSNATTTPALSFSPVAQAQNQGFMSPNGSSGNPGFRKVVTLDISGADATDNTVSYLREDNTWISGKPYSASTTLDCNAYVNSKHSVSASTTITLSNLLEGRTGNIEVTYSGASVITFAVNSGLTLYLSSNIYYTTTNAYTKSVVSKSSGVATYSYYVSGTNVYIQGNQNWN